MKPRPLAVLLHGAVAADAPADEQDTLVQVREIGRALRQLGWRTASLPIGLDLRAIHSLEMMQPQLVFYLVEALGAQGRLLHLPAAVLDSLAITYTGSPSRALFTTTDKVLAKGLMGAAGLPTPELWSPHSAGRFIVKSVHEDASIGIDADAVVDAADVPVRLAAKQAAFGGAWFAERFVEGREFNVPLLASERDGGPEILPIGEMEFHGFAPQSPRIIDYAAKWDPASPAYNNTPRTFLPRPGDGSLRAELEHLSLAAWRAFDLRGYARIDFRIDEQGCPWILEVNANPCLSSDAGFVAAAAELGLNQQAVIARIVSAAIGRIGTGDLRAAS
jgi:D-alanine-D-alanine ligase